MKPLEKASSFVAWPMATICFGTDGKSFTHCLNYSLFAFFTFFYLQNYVRGKAIFEFCKKWEDINTFCSLLLPFFSLLLPCTWNYLSICIS